MKDPAFLFYSSDFLMGTMFFTDEQVGKYIKLMCIQHQKGHIKEKDMLSICKSYDKDIYSKYVKDENGDYYNERLEEEINKRRKYSESRRINRLGAIKDKKNNNHMNNICKSYDKHMENENEDVNESINIIEIINYLNEKTDSNFKSTTQKTKDLIKARFNEKFNLEDFKKVIDNKVNEWVGTEWEKFLRPETLFGNKFESYLNQKKGNKSKLKHKNYEQRDNVDLESFYDNLEQ